MYSFEVGSVDGEEGRDIVRWGGRKGRKEKGEGSVLMAEER